MVSIKSVQLLIESTHVRHYVPDRSSHVRGVKGYGIHLMLRTCGSFVGVRDKGFKYQIKPPRSN